MRPIYLHTRVSGQECPLGSPQGTGSAVGAPWAWHVTTHRISIYFSYIYCTMFVSVFLKAPQGGFRITLCQDNKAPALR